MALRNVKAWHRYSKSGGTPIQKGEMMAVLVEGLSIVVRNEALERKFQGGSARFQDGLSNESICFDNNRLISTFVFVDFDIILVVSTLYFVVSIFASILAWVTSLLQV